MKELEIVKTVFPNIMGGLIAINKGESKDFIDILSFVNESVKSKGSETLGLPSNMILVLKLFAFPFSKADKEQVTRVKESLFKILYSENMDINVLKLL